jgi:hypothetical protein
MTTIDEARKLATKVRDILISLQKINPEEDLPFSAQFVQTEGGYFRLVVDFEFDEE